MATFTSFFLAIMMVLATVPNEAILWLDENSGETTLKITSAGAIVIDFESGEEIYAHNADELFDPASMAKMMTVYLVYLAIENGQIGFDTIVPISASTESLSNYTGISNIPLSQSETYTVDDLLKMAIVSSASAAAAALSELVGGTRREFVSMMNDKADEWGIDAYFDSTYGGGTRTRMTPRAMAAIARNTILQFPQVLEKTSLSSYEFGNRKRSNTNRLLGVYDGIDGYKTGTTTDLSANFTATAERGGTRIISVTMGSKYERRYDDTAALLDYGFAVMEEKLEATRLEEEARMKEEARLEAERMENEARIKAAELEAQRLEEEARAEAARLEAERLEAARLEEERINAEYARRSLILNTVTIIVLACSVIYAGIVIFIKHNKRRP